MSKTCIDCGGPRKGGGFAHRQECVQLQPNLARALNDLRRQLAAKDEEITRLREDAAFWRDEARFFSVSMTKINNVVQPLWDEVRARREDAGRHPQTGKAAKAEEQT